MSSRTINVTSLAQLEELTRRPIPEGERQALQKVIDTFPVRLSAHLVELMRRSPAVAAQFLPDAREVTELDGQTRCFSGLLHGGVHGVERMYPDRCILLPHPVCPAYCRFCFRKFYDDGGGKALSYPELDAALAYVARETELCEVLITGGEPVMDPKRLRYLLEGLRRLPHIGPVRIACRSLIMEPSLVDDALVALLREHQDLRAGRPVEVALHANHPDELTAPTVDALARLREAGLHVYNQAVLLRGVNLDADTLLALFRRLRRHGVESYYLFFGGPVQGMQHMRPSIAEALALKSELRRRSTGRAIPQLILTTRLGKVELGVDGWVVEREPDGRHVWIRTPYTLAGLTAIDPRFTLPEDARLDADGQIVMRYLDGPAAT